MEIKFFCPHCNQHISADTEHIGLQVECPSCSHSFIVPTSQPIAAQEPIQPQRPLVASHISLLALIVTQIKPFIRRFDLGLAAILSKAPFIIPNVVAYIAMAIVGGSGLYFLTGSRDIMDQPFDGSSQATFQRSYERVQKQVTKAQKLEFDFAFAGVAAIAYQAQLNPGAFEYINAGNPPLRDTLWETFDGHTPREIIKWGLRVQARLRE